jgi:hypothetical protein
VLWCVVHEATPTTPSPPPLPHAGFLNAYFPGWFELPSPHRLPFIFNAQRTLQWLTKAAPGYWAAVVGQGIRVLHFSSSPKPWQAKVRGRP